MSANCPVGQYYNNFLQICVAVVQCSAGSYLNKTTQLCQKKGKICGPSQYFDYTVGQCITTKFMTSPYEKNLIDNGFFKSYVSSYNAAVAGANPPTACSPTTPFYQKSTQSCITCPIATPYFDLSTDQCIQCQFNQYYDPYAHNCVSQHYVPYYPSTISRINLWWYTIIIVIYLMLS